jgi:hypothetical protein
MGNVYIIEMYWEPTTPECGVWERSHTYPDTYTESDARSILKKNPRVAYRMRTLEEI